VICREDGREKEKEDELKKLLQAWLREREPRSSWRGKEGAHFLRDLRFSPEFGFHSQSVVFMRSYRSRVVYIKVSNLS